MLIEPLLCGGHGFKETTEENISYNSYSQKASHLCLEKKYLKEN